MSNLEKVNLHGKLGSDISDAIKTAHLYQWVRYFTENYSKESKEKSYKWND